MGSRQKMHKFDALHIATDESKDFEPKDFRPRVSKIIQNGYW